MLPRRHRLTRTAEISAVIRNGTRCRLPHARVYMWISTESSAPKAAVAVGKAVGNSVVRSGVSRRIRHGLMPLMPLLPPGTQVVVRAFESAVEPSSARWTELLRGALGPWLEQSDNASVGTVSVAANEPSGSGQQP